VQTRLGLVILAVDDLPRARTFYRTAFDWPAVADVPVYCEFSLPHGMRLGLYDRRGFARNTGESPEKLPDGRLAPTELYFYPDDIDSAERRLAEAGARRLGERAPRDWGDEASYFADPDGNVIVLARPLPAR